MPFIDANIRAFNSYTKSPKLHSSYFVVCTSHKYVFCAFQSSVNTAYNHLSCFSFPSWYEHSLVRKDWTESNYGLPYLSLPSVSSFSVKIVIQESNTHKKGYDRVIWSRVCLRMPLSSFCTWHNFWLKWKNSELSEFHIEVMK